jgi:signal transduction histidine kinase
MMKHIVLFIFLINFLDRAFSIQPADSLEIELKNATSDSARIRIYNELIFAYRLQDPQKSIELGKEVYPLLNISGKTSDWAMYHKGIGIAYYLKGEFVHAIDHYLKSLDLFESIGDSVQTARSLNNIGIIFEEIRNYEKAKEYYTRCLDIYKIKGENEYIAITTNNLGTVYEDLGDLDSALILHQESLNIALKYGMKERQADSYLNIGSILVKKKEPEKALEYLLKAFKLDQENGNSSGIIETHAVLGEAYLHLNRLSDASGYFQKGLALSLEKGTKDLTSRLYLDLSEYYYLRKDYEQAYRYGLKHIILSDSILNIDTRKQISNLQLQYENDKKEQEISLLTEINELKDAQILSQKDKSSLLVIIVLFLIILSGLLWVYYRIYSRANNLLEKKNKKISEQNTELELQSKKLQELSAEKDNMIGVVAHDLKSPLSKILGLTGLIRLTGNMPKDQTEYLNLIEKVIADANKLIGRILDLNKLESGQFGPNLSKVNLKSILDEVTLAFRKSAEDKKIRICQSCHDNIEFITDRDMIFSIVDNLVSNAIKFSDKDKTIFLDCHKNGTRIILSVKDEGPGIRSDEIPLLFKKYTRLSARPTGGESSTGLGLAIVELAVEKLNGGIEVKSELKKGSEFIVSLPYSGL